MLDLCKWTIFIGKNQMHFVKIDVRFDVPSTVWNVQYVKSESVAPIAAHSEIYDEFFKWRSTKIIWEYLPSFCGLSNERQKYLKW